jgi:hypothetical protein
MDSIDSNMDLELIAALLDGRLSGAERERAIKLLADSDEALKVFAGALRQGGDRSHRDDRVVPIPAAHRRSAWKIAVAAAVLAIAIVPSMLRRKPQATLGHQYVVLLETNPRFITGLPANWHQQSWSVTRGPALHLAGTQTPGSTSDSKNAFRVGLRSLDLEIALRRADRARAGQLTDELADLLRRSVAVSESAVDSYMQLKSRIGTDSIADLLVRSGTIERELHDMMASPSFDFGQWVGAADVAAQMRYASFFQSANGTAAIRSAMPTSSLAAEDTAALHAIDTRLRAAPTDRTLDEIHDILQTIVRRWGG